MIARMSVASCLFPVSLLVCVRFRQTTVFGLTAGNRANGPPVPLIFSSAHR
jgi:hypothetical protein